jgi:hypothetical protein
MARDAIARQYDVDKNSVMLTCEPGKESYRPGTITFRAKEGKSINLDQIVESITATRLSGNTNMGMEYLEITAEGVVEASAKEAVLKVSGTGQQFVLREAPSAKGALQRLRDAVARGEKVTSVTGRVDGWKGRFPVALSTLAKTPASQGRTVLFVTEFDVAKK